MTWVGAVFAITCLACPTRRFSRVGNFTGYMQVMFDELTQRLQPPARTASISTVTPA
jgi:hypothetical protein